MSDAADFELARSVRAPNVPKTQHDHDDHMRMMTHTKVRLTAGNEGARMDRRQGTMSTSFPDLKGDFDDGEHSDEDGERAKDEDPSQASAAPTRAHERESETEARRPSAQVVEFLSESFSSKGKAEDLPTAIGHELSASAQVVEFLSESFSSKGKAEDVSTGMGKTLSARNSPQNSPRNSARNSPRNSPRNSHITEIDPSQMESLVKLASETHSRRPSAQAVEFLDASFSKVLAPEDASFEVYDSAASDDRRQPMLGSNESEVSLGNGPVFCPTLSLQIPKEDEVSHVTAEDGVPLFVGRKILGSGVHSRSPSKIIAVEEILPPTDIPLSAAELKIRSDASKAHWKTAHDKVYEKLVPALALEEAGLQIRLRRGRTLRQADYSSARETFQTRQRDVKSAYRASVASTQAHGGLARTTLNAQRLYLRDVKLTQQMPSPANLLSAESTKNSQQQVQMRIEQFVQRLCPHLHMEITCIYDQLIDQRDAMHAIIVLESPAAAQEALNAIRKDGHAESGGGTMSARHGLGRLSWHYCGLAWEPAAFCGAGLAGPARLPILNKSAQLFNISADGNKTLQVEKRKAVPEQLAGGRPRFTFSRGVGMR